MQKIRVGAVNYLNTKPLLHGIRNHRVMQQIEIVEDYPARVADMLLNDQVDVGLVPVVTLLRMREWNIVGNYCIGCDGPVASVCIFSEVPIEQVTRVYLDYQSRTSVLLAQLLLKKYWKIAPELVNASGEEFRAKIGGTAGALVIGDRALEQGKQSAFTYDLGEAWKKHTGLPFVFAAWISKEKLSTSFVEAFDEANAKGIADIDALTGGSAERGYDLKDYYEHNISYLLDDAKRKGMDHFLRSVSER